MCIFLCWCKWNNKLFLQKKVLSGGKKSKKRLWHKSMVSQQRSMPPSLNGSMRGSVTSLNSLNLDSNLEPFGRSLSMVDMKRDTISLCSFSENNEIQDGVFRKKDALTQLLSKIFFKSMYVLSRNLKSRFF